jgi:chemotaxis protein methyltransferase CheR
MNALTQIADLVQRESGIRLTQTQHPTLQAALARALPRLDPAGFLRRAADPATGHVAIAQLLDELTVKETYFLRDHRQLAMIDWQLLLQRSQAAGSDRVRVWSAPCATGEEAYTLALLASEAFGRPDPPVSILATDISGAALADARAGSYRARSVRDLTPSQRTTHFREVGGNFVVNEALRALVRFAQHNLVTDSAPPRGEEPFQLILCRNILIYFDGETVERVLASLERALADSGALVLGAADALCASARRLTLTRAGVPSPAPALLRRPLGRPPAQPVIDEAGARFLDGLAELEAGDAAAAVRSLRHALFSEPGFGLAAFQLARAHEAAGDVHAARRAYQRALRTLAMDDERNQALLGQVDPEDLADAARARLAVLGER